MSLLRVCPQVGVFFRAVGKPESHIIQLQETGLSLWIAYLDLLIILGQTKALAS